VVDDSIELCLEAREGSSNRVNRGHHEDQAGAREAPSNDAHRLPGGARFVYGEDQNIRLPGLTARLELGQTAGARDHLDVIER
jgi:hypothetical protein